MQYKDSPKIMIDERKLEILFRLGCPDAQIIELLKTKTFTPTGDKLIDDTLECLIDCKHFDNRGGNHNPTGKNQYTKNESGQSGQNDRSKTRSNDWSKTGQTTDKDIELEYNNNNINNNNSRNLIPENNIQDNNKLSGISNNLSTTHASEEDRTLEIQFNTFWEAFPKQRKAGKTKPRQKFFQIVKSKQATAEQLIKAAEDYAKSDTVIRGYAKEPYSWLLNERYLCDYTTQIRPMPQMSLKEMKQMQNEIELEKIRRGEK